MTEFTSINYVTFPCTPFPYPFCAIIYTEMSSSVVYKKITLILSGTQIEQNSLEGMSFCVIISDNTTLIIKLKQIVYLSVYVSESLPH